MATGTPEQVAAVEASYTGRFLRGLVEPAETPRRRTPQGRRGGLTRPGARRDEHLAAAARRRRGGGAGGGCGAASCVT